MGQFKSECLDIIMELLYAKLLYLCCPKSFIYQVLKYPFYLLSDFTHVVSFLRV